MPQPQQALGKRERRRNREGRPPSQAFSHDGDSMKKIRLG